MLTGEKATELAVFVAEEIAAETSDVGRRIIANRIIEAARKAAGIKEPEAAPIALSAPVMSDVEKLRFEQRVAPWSQYKGERIKDVPLSFLTWLSDQKLIDHLRAYLRRPDVREEIEHQKSDGTFYGDNQDDDSDDE